MGADVVRLNPATAEVATVVPGCPSDVLSGWVTEQPPSQPAIRAEQVPSLAIVEDALQREDAAVDQSGEQSLDIEAMFPADPDLMTGPERDRASWHEVWVLHVRADCRPAR